MPRTASRAVSPSSRSPSTSSMLPSASARARCSRFPLEKLSTTRTRAPFATSASTRVEPINEAPPVTNTLVFIQSITMFLLPRVSRMTSRASRHFCLSFRFCLSPRKTAGDPHRRRTQSPHSRSRRCSHFFREHSRRIFRIPVFPAFSRHQPAGRSSHSEQRPAARQQESRRKRLLRRNDRRIQHFHRRNLFCFLHLGHFVLLGQQLIHRLLDLGLPEKIGVGHSEQRELPNRRIQIIRFHVRTVAAHLLQFRL